MAKDIETTTLTIADVKFNEQGLVPCIVQDADTKNVLMMAWMNAESLRLTVEQRTTWFYSRSRQKLWHKGEESGNTQELVALHYDCDADTLLALVRPEGPACHTGNYTCFYRSFGAGEWDESGNPVVAETDEGAGKLRSQGMKEKLNIKLLEESEGYARMRMPIVASITQPAGFVHGGATITLLETVASWASWRRSDLENEMSFGSHVDIKHVGPAKKGCLFGEARLENINDLGKKGRKEFWRVEATDDDGRLISTGIITCRVVSKEYFAGRNS